MKQVKRTYDRYQKIVDKVKAKHPDWTTEQVENEATNIMLGLSE